MVEHSQESLRKEVTDSVVKQIANYTYKMKQLVTIKSTNAWRNNFFREQLTRLSATGGGANPGIPRGAEFPNATLDWTEVQTYIQKYGLTDTIPYEDIISNEFKVDDRVLQKLGEGVAWAVDKEIFLQTVQGTDLTTGVLSAADIQSQLLTAGAWDESSAQIVKDVASAKKLIRDYYYNVNDFVLVINGNDEVNLVHYLYEKGAQAPTIGVDMALNGSAGKVAGAQVIISDVVPASFALLVVPKKYATWEALVPLSTDRVDRKFKDTQLTVCEMGKLELTDPKAVVVLETRDAL